MSPTTLEIEIQRHIVRVAQCLNAPNLASTYTSHVAIDAATRKLRAADAVQRSFARRWSNGSVVMRANQKLLSVLTPLLLMSMSCRDGKTLSRSTEAGRTPEAGPRGRAS